MKDPLDNQTLCLIEAARRPLTNAERQKRRRLRLARERAAGRSIPLGDVTLAELQVLKLALATLQGETPARSELIDGLLQRLEAAAARAGTTKGKEPNANH